MLHLDNCNPGLRPESDPNDTSQLTTTARDNPPSPMPGGHPATTPPQEQESQTQTLADIEQGIMTIKDCEQTNGQQQKNQEHK